MYLTGGGKSGRSYSTVVHIVSVNFSKSLYSICVGTC